MATREERKRLAGETLLVIDTGILPISSQVDMDISSLIYESVADTSSYPELLSIPQPLPKKKGIQTEFCVLNTTTLGAARDLLIECDDANDDSDDSEVSKKNDDKQFDERDMKKKKKFLMTEQTPKISVAVLNFASAKNPGGGFRKGSMAQEESLALNSALYACLKDDKMYEYHRNQSNDGLYSDWVIFSPNVPIFRNEIDGSFIEPWPCSIITCPCINKKLEKSNLEGSKKSKMKKQSLSSQRTKSGSEPQLQKRAKRMLRVLAAHHDGHIVLGAWGCGVFGNDPNTIAKIFSDLLRTDETFVNRWPKVVFAVLDRSETGRTFQAFKDVFYES